jgi:hypothetical protein
VADGTRTHDDRNHNPVHASLDRKALLGILWNVFCKLGIDSKGFSRLRSTIFRVMDGCGTLWIYTAFKRAMPRHQLPDFASPSTENLRELYRRSDDDLTRRTVLEVIRLRDLVIEIDSFRESVEKAWKAEGHGQLVALYQFRRLMQDERSRMGLPRVRVEGEATGDDKER